MAEEFSESEVVFSDTHQTFDDCREEEPPQMENSQAGNGEAEAKKVVRSLPVKIPERMMLRRWNSGEDEEEKEMVPPHVILARRVAGKMAFSVCTGNGRTLKGRDLCRVRNSILRMTGFIEV